MTNFPGCATAVQELNPTATVCSAQHCSDFTESATFHDNCNTFGKGQPLYPVSTAQCKNKNPPYDIKEPSYDPQWGTSCDNGYALQMCYCCCSCLANGTLIAIPDGTKAIQLFSIGDAVTVGKYDASGLSWSAGTVAFSSGSDAGSDASMIFVDYADGRQLIASIDHLFLLASGKLKRADRLVPGIDQLMSAEGNPIDIKGTHSGKWTNGLHHIATGAEFSGTLDSHLLNSAGVVSADYYLQINQQKLIDAGLMDSADVSPALGSAEYAAKNPHLTVSPVSALLSAMTLGDVNPPDGFALFDPTGSIHIPPGAASFLTAAQAHDILTNPIAKFNDAHVDSGFDAIQYLAKVFKGFYPDIDILVDQGRQDFNAYAFEIYGHNYIVVAGGIVRLNGLFSEGYKFILSHLVARLLGLKPYDDQGFTYVAAADFYATSLVIRNVFFLEGDSLSNGIIDQINLVFGLISPQNAGGNPKDVANDPSIRCRSGNLQTGIFGGSVLDCACDNFDLNQAIVDTPIGGKMSLRLIFNRPVDPASARFLSNYSFSSATGTALPTVASASVRDGQPEQVELLLAHTPSGNFKVTVAKVVAANGSQLGASNSADFKL